MDDVKIVVALLLVAVLFPYLTIMLAIMRYERRSCRKMEEAMIKEKYVTHGHWVIVDDFIDDDFIHYKCSECGRDCWYNEEQKAEAKYCFRCGAKMDGDPHDSC